MATNTGWIKLHRDIRKHWVFQRPDYFQYWVDLLMMANHQSKTWLYNDKLIPIRRGEVATSIVQLSERWGCSRNKIRRFLKLLEKEQMIDRKSDTLYTHLSICNYDTYQDKGTTEGTTKGQQKGQLKDRRRDTTKELKNVKNEKNINGSVRVKPYTERIEAYFSSIQVDLLKTWSEAYPNINVAYEIKKAKAWLISNPKNAKSNFSKFLNNWLSRAMENPSSKSSIAQPPKIHDYICTNCSNEQKSKEPSYKAECSECGYNTLVTKQEATYL